MVISIHENGKPQSSGHLVCTTYHYYENINDVLIKNWFCLHNMGKHVDSGQENIEAYTLHFM